MRIWRLAGGTILTLLWFNRRLRLANAALVRQRDQAERVARVDPLTGLGNRRHFDEELTRELARAARSGWGLGVMMLDLDGFKEVNDSHGHRAGDEVLVEVGRRLEGAVRSYDVVTRWGGDEFAVIAPEVPDAESVARIAESIRAAVASSAIRVTGATVEVTASVGAVRVQGRGFTAADVLPAADRALGEAKTVEVAAARVRADVLVPRPAPGVH